jgi:hypothetical protein
MVIVRPKMSKRAPEESEPPDKRINWSIWVLVTAGFALVGGLAAPLRLWPAIPGKAWFWIALVSGGAIGLVVNLARPNYESSTGKWRSFYDFLLRQMPPPN